MEITVKYLPFLAVSLLVITVIVTLCMSLYQKHVTGSIPYISDTGASSPESCVFGQALNIFWILVTFIVYVKYKQVKDILNRYNMENKKVLNRTTMQIGLLAAFGVSIVANFQEITLFYVHWCGAVLAFGPGAIYLCLQTVLYIRLRKILGQRKIIVFRAILSAISFATFSAFFVCAIFAYRDKKDDNYLHWIETDGGFVLHNISVISEWIFALSLMIYLGLFYCEFKKITLYEPDVFVEDRITTELNMSKTNGGFQEV